MFFSNYNLKVLTIANKHINTCSIHLVGKTPINLDLYQFHKRLNTPYMIR
jgi:hypothetical protein